MASKILSILTPMFKLAFKYAVLIITAYVALESWVVSKAKTVVEPVESKIMAVHREGMIGINDRFAENRQYQEQRFNRLEELIIKGN